MKVEFTKNYKDFKVGDSLDLPDFALEEYLTAGVVKEYKEPPKKKPAPKRKPAQKE